MAAKASGRPREFELQQAAEAAMHVFWARGYEGASIAELTEAMGISKPSLYAAFGDKRGLFDAALALYVQGPLASMTLALDAPTAHEAALQWLRGAVEVATHTTGPRGCLSTHAALACGPEADEVRDTMAKRRLAAEARLRAKLREAQKTGELPAEADTGALAKYIVTVAQGITVQGASGVSRRELNNVVEMAMLAWPASRPKPHSAKKSPAPLH